LPGETQGYRNSLLHAYVFTHPAAVVFVGEGSECPALEAGIARHGLSGVTIAGFVNQGDVARYDAAADVLVLPSGHEPWGLVLNEGMCFGLPVVASDAVGAAADLVHNEDNGFVYPVGDVAALARAPRRLLIDPKRRREIEARSQAIVASFSYAADIDGILAAGRRISDSPRLGLAS
jgi:glycosyltransferase involved in cell wall biosynthesis